MIKMKKVCSVILVFLIIFSLLNVNSVKAEAKEYSAVYEGTLISMLGSGICVFTVYSLDDGSFTGHIYNSKNPKIDMDVSGNLYKYSDYYECVFSATSTYSFDIKVYAREGRAECRAGGGVFFVSDCTLYGTVDKLYGIDFYIEDDMKMCMEVLE